MTGSVGLLPDAAETMVNLVAAIVALGRVRSQAQTTGPHNHSYGITKAEYFGAAVEGLIIFAAAAAILMTFVQRFLEPQPLENSGIGLGVSVLVPKVAPRAYEDIRSTSSCVLCPAGDGTFLGQTQQGVGNLTQHGQQDNRQDQAIGAAVILRVRQ